MILSMSGKDNSYDNVLAETLFSTLKNELINDHTCRTRKRRAERSLRSLRLSKVSAISAVAQSLTYLSPLEFERQSIDS